MKKHKRKFEDYEEIALDIRTAIQLLDHIAILYQRAKLSDKLSKITGKLYRIKSDLENEMFKDWPERASTNVFYGGKAYQLDIRKHHDYIYSSFGVSSCEQVDAFAILTRQGVVLLSDDAKVTPVEDAYLHEINLKMIERKMKDEDLHAR